MSAEKLKYYFDLFNEECISQEADFDLGEPSHEAVGDVKKFLGRNQQDSWCVKPAMAAAILSHSPMNSPLYVKYEKEVEFYIQSLVDRWPELSPLKKDASEQFLLSVVDLTSQTPKVYNRLSRRLHDYIHYVSERTTNEVCAASDNVVRCAFEKAFGQSSPAKKRVAIFKKPKSKTNLDADTPVLIFSYSYSSIKDFRIEHFDFVDAIHKKDSVLVREKFRGILSVADEPAAPRFFAHLYLLSAFPKESIGYKTARNYVHNFYSTYVLYAPQKGASLCALQEDILDVLKDNKDAQNDMLDVMKAHEDLDNKMFIEYYKGDVDYDTLWDGPTAT